jgi:hypothetical protein
MVVFSAAVLGCVEQALQAIRPPKKRGANV